MSHSKRTAVCVATLLSLLGAPAVLIAESPASSWTVERIVDDRGRLTDLLAQHAEWDGAQFVDRVYVLKVNYDGDRPQDAVVVKRKLEGLAGDYSIERVDYGFGFYYHDDGAVQAFTISHYPEPMKGLDFIYDANGALLVGRTGEYAKGEGGAIEFKEQAQFRADATTPEAKRILALSPSARAPKFDAEFLSGLICYVSAHDWEKPCVGRE